ncbi:uncharacterized protein [Halyomorpha halys]|uniref:uncharacterized protein n=1 Tax=Halyomorpha halys TaxID=286706 RepID=UPI0034D2ED77
MVFLPNLLFLSLATFYLCVSCYGRSTGKKADIVFKYVEKCPRDMKTEWNYTLKTSKLSRTKTQVSFSALTKEPLDDKLKADLMVSIWTNGGWKSNFFHFVVTGLCTALKTKMKKVMQKLATDSNFTMGCPIRKGELRMNNFLVDMKDYGSYPVIPYSKLRVTTMLLRGNVRLVCTNSFLDIEPSI